MRHTSESHRHRTAYTQANQQRGVVLIFTLIALMVLMLGSVALIRSMSTSSFMSGNLAFKRDLANHGERGMAQALTLLRSGALSSDVARQSSQPTSNYSPTVFASNAQGVPLVLINQAAYGAASLSAADITDAAAGVTVRYVIDRQCVAGTTSVSASNCMVATTKGDKGGSEYLASKKPGGDLRPIYRISVRVDGPRGTQSFLQTTVTL
jgi:type IV pilus assembly protein PilX